MIAWLKRFLRRAPAVAAPRKPERRRSPVMHYVPRAGDWKGDRWVMVSWCGVDDPDRYTFDAEELCKVEVPCAGCLPGLRAARIHRLTHR